MRKLIDKAILKYIELKLWLHAKKNGSTWNKFQFGLFWMLIMILTSMLIGKILRNILNFLSLIVLIWWVVVKLWIWSF